MPREMITAVLTAHNEGMLAKPSLESLKRSAARAESSGYGIEIIVVLDRADAVTREVVHRHVSPGTRIIETDFGDPGMARNRAVAAARGRYVGFLDADDLWGVNWLESAATLATTRPDSVIWHPEICAYFGAARHVFRHIDMETEDFSLTGLMIENYWTALSFASRQVYMENPYPETDLVAGFGFEDWTWNMQTISRGIVHKIVPGTGHVIRRRPHSVSRETIDAQAVPRPTAYIRTYLHNRQRTA